MRIDFDSLHFEDAPKIVTDVPGPRSREILRLQKMYEGNAVTYSRGIPIAIEEARGATLRDVDGNIYIDFFGGAAVVAAGHSNPVILEVVRSQEEKLIHTLDLATSIREKLVSRLVSLAPGELRNNAKILFGGPTGSDAVEAAVKLAKFYSRRHLMISFEGSYHGMTGIALALTGDTFFKKAYMPLGQPVQFVPYAYCYRCAFGLEYPSCGLACIKYIDHILEDPASGVCDVAGVIVEPIQGEGGSIVPPTDFIRELRYITEKHGVLLIIDEVQAGLGRTGRLFACEHFGVTPDIMTVSKALGGGIGLPLSGIIYRKDLDVWNPGAHIGTFRGFLPAMAGGLAYLDFIEHNNVLQHVEDLGNYMLRWLKELEEKSNIVGEARGRGLMLGVEIVHDKESKKPAPDLAKKLRTECVRRGIIIEIGGHYHNVARFLPPLVLTKELAERGLSIFEEALATIENKT